MPSTAILALSIDSFVNIVNGIMEDIKLVKGKRAIYFAFLYELQHFRKVLFGLFADLLVWASGSQSYNLFA